MGSHSLQHTVLLANGLKKSALSGFTGTGLRSTQWLCRCACEAVLHNLLQSKCWLHVHVHVHPAHIMQLCPIDVFIFLSLCVPEWHVD